MSNQQSRPQFPSRSGNSRGMQRRFLSAPVTSAVGLEETTRRVRGRRSSLFTRTLIWVTGLICLAFLLGALAQAWSNSQLIQGVETAQQQLQHMRQQHDSLTKLVVYYKDPFVIENEARQQFGYVRPGEHAIVVIGANSQEQSTSSHLVNPPPTQGYWQEWWNAFFGK